MTRTFFVLGALLAGIGIAAGAFGAHALHTRIPAGRLDTWEIAVRYQVYHGLALLAVAWGTDRWPGAGLQLGGWLLLAGALIFAATLYAIALGAPRWLGAVTPLGGVCLIAGWLVLAWRVWHAQ